MKIRDFIAETRLPFTSASAVPVLLGTAYAYHHVGVFSWLPFLLALFSIVLLHLGANVLNDYYDWRTGTDNVNTTFVRPFTGGSRMIQKGILTPREVLAEGMILLAAGSALGIFLVVRGGLFILALGAAGVFLGVFHSAPPVKLHSRSLGEAGIGLAFGVLPVLGAYYLQTLAFSWKPVLVSLPVAFLIAAVLFVNGFQDRAADRATGKYTLTVTLGRAAPHFLVLLLMLPFAAVPVMILHGILPIPSLVVFALFPLAYQGSEFCLKYSHEPFKMVPANASVVALHLLFGVVYSLSLLIKGYLFLGIFLVIALVVSLKALMGIRKTPPEGVPGR